MKYFGGCDVGSTYTKAVILDENGKMCADTTIRSKINAEQSAIADCSALILLRIVVSAHILPFSSRMTAFV